MIGTLLTRFLTRSLLNGSKSIRSRGAKQFHWTTVKRTNSFLINGRAAVCLALPTVCYLGFEACRGVRGLAVVHALEKVEDVLEQADYLYSCAEIEKLYQLLHPYKESTDVEFLWRLARVTRDMGLTPGLPADQKKTLVMEAYEYAKKALELDDNNYASHKWYAILLNDISDYKGNKFKLQNAFDIRKHLERAAQINPKDATTRYILGFWCFAFAELPWYQRKLASVIFATPPTSTYEEALGFFLAAEEVSPGFYSKNQLMLGRTYLALSDKDKALLWLTKAKDYRPVTWEDKEVQKEAVQLLKTLS